mmetsp:Transcript_18280/g.27393  ORF Transcript_18280/g.27393 Transcript_18280/m.27393 type:complete len:118 (+) Transcript_18280:81-434(+)
MDSKTLKEKAENYFKVWNSQDLKELEKCFVSKDAYLRDWDVEVKGTKNVVEANGKIFKAVPAIKIDIVSLYPCPEKCTISCEILVKLNDEKKTVLKVVDIIKMTGDGEIESVKAYKG